MTQINETTIEKLQKMLRDEGHPLSRSMILRCQKKPGWTTQGSGILPNDMRAEQGEAAGVGYIEHQQKFCQHHLDRENFCVVHCDQYILTIRGQLCVVNRQCLHTNAQKALY
jgi:hypothetical protein